MFGFGKSLLGYIPTFCKKMDISILNNLGYAKAEVLSKQGGRFLFLCTCIFTKNKDLIYLG